MYEPRQERFTTPRGQPVTMWVREGTNDWNTLSSCLDMDEYGLRDLHLDGWAIDVGAYLGGVAVALAMDNPELHVLAVEPVPSNVELLQRNVEANELTDRIRVIDGAVAAPGTPTVSIFYGYRGTESLEHHAFVGNSTLAYDTGGETEHDERELVPWSLSELLAMCDGPVSFVKIDTEGAEFAFLSDPAVAKVPRIYGEWHNVRGHTQADVTALLPDHKVTFSGARGRSWWLRGGAAMKRLRCWLFGHRKTPRIVYRMFANGVGEGFDYRCERCGR